jgi:hypothetical protein
VAHLSAAAADVQLADGAVGGRLCGEGLRPDQPVPRRPDDALGIARLVLGYPPYALLLLVTVYSVRRVLRQAPDPAT